MDTKKQIRQEVLQKRDALSEKQRAEENAKITAHILASSFYQNASALLIFASYHNEVDTFSFARRALKEGRHLYYPVVCGKEMEFYRVDDPSELKEGYRGILEPQKLTDRRFLPENCGKILMLMPGVCFDRNGGRIGYGGGYYDKYLARLTNAKVPLTTAALAFDCQLLDTGVIPREEHDMTPDYIITPQGIYFTQNACLSIHSIV